MAPTESGHELIMPSSSSEEEEHCVHAMELVSAAVFPMVMEAAIDLDLLEIIARAGSGAHLSAEEIASQLPTQNPEAPQMVDRILRLLVSHSVLTCSIAHDHDHALKPSHDGDAATVVKRLYGLTPTSNYYLRNQEGISLTPLMHLFHDKAFMDCWYVLKDAVLEGGIPFEKLHGVNAFEYLGKDPRLNLLFNRGMSNYTTFVMKNILEKYSGFEDIKELVDVGGGLGLALKMVTSKHPTIKAINFDLPHVIQHAPPYPGVEHISGDMFVGIPKGDAILMRGIIHDWSDDESLKILKNCYAALPDDGKVIVIELIAPEAPEKNAASRLVFQSDLIMMAQNPGGKERTKLQFQSLATRAGFGGIKFQCCISSYWVMEFYK